jgi:anti-sigma factor RsiW
VNGKMTCARVRERIAGYPEGWLNSSERAALERHLTACADCSAELARDTRLVSVLAALKEETPPPATWTQARAAHAAPSRSVRPFRRLVPALATATLAVVLALFLWPRGSRPPVISPPFPPSAETTAPETAYEDAHLALAAADTLGDPNRAVIALYAAQRGSGAVR